MSEDPIGFEAGDGNLYRYVGNGVTVFVDPSGLEVRDPRVPPSRIPDDPVGRWTPEEFFGEGSPLIYQTKWGCGGVAAWRAGVELDFHASIYNPFDIKELPGTKPYNTLKAAVSAQKALGKQGALIVARKIRPAPDKSPQNYASLLGESTDWYWEDMTGARGVILHHGSCPGATDFIVVPGNISRFQSPVIRHFEA